MRPVRLPGSAPGGAELLARYRDCCYARWLRGIAPRDRQPVGHVKEAERVRLTPIVPLRARAGRAQGEGQAVSAPGGTGAGGDRVSRSGSVEAQAPTHLVLVHDRVG